MFALVAELVAAYVANNSVPVSELPKLIKSVQAALAGLYGGTGAESAGAAAEKVNQPTPAQIKKSIRPDGLVSFIDGKTYQTLKRHLNGHGLHPHSYRERFGLPSDYPMTAPDYSARRSALAKSIGLGRPGRIAT
ncbi:MucR family transcriptional regulator [Methylobacterium sp. WL103]|uniref:MucR family transcriptional regulator n=1 Tax=Methylobacterium sp. WL103 TaxID=2603891 RepID=UPI0011C966EC|nr:MucR family transcriptional regulator [Methylobacterium sp. WL103]TXN05821.1 MucR family transcriptional regulator [Methylobacterium sp. WL103]